MDFGQKMDFYTLDTLSEFVFGENIGFLKRDEDIGRLTRFTNDSLQLVTAAGLIPWFSNLRFKWPFKYVMPQENDRTGFEYLSR